MQITIKEPFLSNDFLDLPEFAEVRKKHGDKALEVLIYLFHESEFQIDRYDKRLKEVVKVRKATDKELNLFDGIEKDEILSAILKWCEMQKGRELQLYVAQEQLFYNALKNIMSPVKADGDDKEAKTYETQFKNQERLNTLRRSLDTLGKELFVSKEVEEKVVKTFLRGSAEYQAAKRRAK